MVNYFLYGFIFVGIVSLILLIFILIFFGNVIWLQFRIWILAKRGYHVVEHIGEDNVRRFYYMRPKDQHFDINDGFMLFMPDSITKQQGILKKFDKRLLFDGHRIPQEVFEKLSQKQKETYLKLYEADKKEAKEYYDSVNNLHYYVDAVTLRYGIPTVTYVGTSSEPVNFKTLHKTYDAKTLKDLYLRILLTQKYGIFKKIMIIAILVMSATAIILFMYYLYMSGLSGNYHTDITTCISNWNATQNSLLRCVNETARIVTQNTTFNI